MRSDINNVDTNNFPLLTRSFIPGLMLQWAVFKHIQALYRDLCPCMHVLLGACYVQVGYRVLLFGSRAHDIFISINHL